MLVVLVWVVATVGVTYVANAAVELVDLQVFPQGARIEVLARAEPTPTTLPRMRATTAPPVASTTVAAPATTVAAPTTTVATPIATTTTVVVATTTLAVAPTTTLAVAPTTTVAGAPATTTTVVPVATTTRPPPTTTQPPPVTTMTMAPVAPLALLDQGHSEHRLGADYRERLVTGGDAPFELSIVSGDLPPGLQIDEEGYLWGKLEVSGRFEAQLEVVDSAGRVGSGTISVFVKEFRIITARGGSVTVVVAGDSVEFFSALQGADFESAQILRSGPIVVEVSFVPTLGDETSWVRCEVIEQVVCTSG